MSDQGMGTGITTGTEEMAVVTDQEIEGLNDFKQIMPLIQFQQSIISYLLYDLIYLFPLEKFNVTEKEC